MQSDMKSLHAAAVALRGNVPGDCRARGICYYLLSRQSLTFDEFTAREKLINAAIACWPERTDNEFYPVPHPTLSPSRAYNMLDDLWSGEYGDARRRLLDHIIKETAT